MTKDKKVYLRLFLPSADPDIEDIGAFNSRKKEMKRKTLYKRVLVIAFIAIGIGVCLITWAEEMRQDRHMDEIMKKQIREMVDGRN